MKLISIKFIVAFLSVPAYPFITVGQYVEKRRYFGNQSTFRKVSEEYWGEVWDVLTYRKEVD